jgi:hypothetical protein
MKGNPILRLCLVLLLLAGVLVPVYRLALTDSNADPTANAAPSPSTSESGSAPSLLPARLLLHAAPSALSCAITLRGKTLLTEKNLLSPGEYAADAQVAPGDDLLITAEWSDDLPHAVRVEFLPQGMCTPVSRSYWAKRSLEDVLTIPVTTER